MRTAFSVSKSVPAKVAAIVIPVAASGPIPSGVGLNRAQLAALGFEGKASQTHSLAPAAGKTAVRVLVGIGDVRDLNTSVLRNVAASAARACARYESIATTLPGVIRGSAKASTQAVVEGFALALHRWVALKNDKSGLAKLTSVTLVSAEKTADVQAGMVMGIATSTAVCTARDFANTPPSHLTARQFADHAVAIANASGLEVTVYNRDQLIAMGCGGIVGVNAGSTEPPRMVKLVYTPASAKGKVVLVGKGVMYDSGGIIVFNRPLDMETAKAVNEIFTEILIAPAFEDGVLDLLIKKKDRRLVQQNHPLPKGGWEFKSTPFGMLVQERDSKIVAKEDLTVVTKRQPTAEELDNLMFAWKICKHIKSNTILYVKNRQTFGVGAGQMSRVDSSKIARWKASEVGLDLHGSVVASDAFFPFADGLLAAAEAGVTAVIQPGGSIRDNEIIEAADANNLAMVFSGMRHFKH